MAETTQTAAEIQEIRYRLEAIEATQTLLVRDRSKGLLEDYLSLFEKEPDLKHIYVLIDGNRTQIELVAEMKAQEFDMSPATMHRRVKTLVEAGLIELVPSDGLGNVYEKNRAVERILHLSKKLK